MIVISEFLKRFAKVGESERDFKQSVVNVISDITGIHLSADNINYINGTVHINTGNIEKAEIAMRKESIVRKIKELGLKKRVTDLR